MFVLGEMTIIFPIPVSSMSRESPLCGANDAAQGASRFV